MIDLRGVLQHESGELSGRRFRRPWSGSNESLGAYDVHIAT